MYTNKSAFTTDNPKSAANPRNVVIAQTHNAAHTTNAAGQLPSEIYSIEQHETAQERESKRAQWQAFVARVIGATELFVLLSVIASSMLAVLS